MEPVTDVTSTHVTLHQRGGGLGKPTGARTFISGFSEKSAVPQSVLSDNGLGWPGTFLPSDSFAARNTLQRLNQTPAEAEANETRLADAVKVILACIGEDPERDGLRDTPKRYARALLWLTKGYQEKLCGAYCKLLMQMLFRTLFSTRTTTKW